MNKPNKLTISKYLESIKKSKLRYISADDLSEIVGVYPSVIIDNLSYFEPIINIDTEYNIVELVPQMEAYLVKKPVAEHKNKKKDKKEKLPYQSLNQFIRDKMTFGGMFDNNAQLSSEDLRILKKIVINEINKNKDKKH